MRPPVTICVLVYGDYPHLARRALESIWNNTDRSQYELFVGANEPSARTWHLLERAHLSGGIDKLIVSQQNLSKCPMMRRLFAEVQTELIWWFDDDSWVTEPHALSRWLQTVENAPASTVLWGQIARCDHTVAFTEIQDVIPFVRAAPWFRGLPPPSWRPGGKGEFTFPGPGGDGRWFFVLGGCWLIRTAAVRALDWPDPRLRRHGDDVFLGEAIRQQGWSIAPVHPSGVDIDTEPRRGESVPTVHFSGDWHAKELAAVRSG